MTIFASAVRKTLTFKDVTFIIHKVPGFTLDRARLQKQIDNAQMFRSFGGEMVRVFREEKPAPVDPIKSRYDALDRFIMIQSGLESWDTKDEQGKPLPITNKEIENLDEETVAFLFKEIVDLSIPIVDLQEAERQAKNDTGRSTESSIPERPTTNQ